MEVRESLLARYKYSLTTIEPAASHAALMFGPKSDGPWLWE